MARTHVQQSQISGSLSFSDSLGAGASLEGQNDLIGDLNALRSQIKRAIGETNWYSDVNQDLADIYGAMHAVGTGADFMGAISTVASASIGGNITGSAGLAIAAEATIGGTLDVTGVATFDAAITGSAGLQLAGDLDVNSSADISGQVDLAASGVATNVRGTLDVTEDATFNGNVTLGSDGSDSITFSAVAASNLDMASNKVVGLGQADTTGDALGWGQVAYVTDLTASGKIFANNEADTVGHMYFVGPDHEIKASDDMFFVGGLLTLSGSADISGSLTVGNGLTVAGDAMEISGTFGVSGSSALDGALSVSGLATLNGGLTVNNAAADFNADVTANKISIDSDVAQRLYIVDADGSIKDEEKLTFDGSELLVTGSAKLTSNLTVEGGVITLSNGASIDSDAVAGELKLDEDLVVVTGDLKVSGNDISGSSGLNITLESAGDVTIAGSLKLMGNQLKSSAGNVVLELSGDDAFFKSDVNIAGDLYVKGAMTYIETTNLKVQDAFIHLATGSTGAESSGIVLHGGAGAADDLLMAQDAGAGEFVFGKLAHSSGDHSNIDSNNLVAISNIELVPVWMSELKLGVNEGVMSGGLLVNPAPDSGITLTSADKLDVTVAGGLNLSANGENAISFIEVSEWSTFSGSFGGSSSIVGALNSLASAAASSAAKAVYYSTDFAGDELDFSALGVVPSADHKYVDVYLNGVLLTQGLDVVSVATGSVTLENGIVSGLTGDDVITVTLRNAS